MTVSELIALLSELPPDTLVVGSAGDWGNYACKGIETGYFTSFAHDDEFGHFWESKDWIDPDEDPPRCANVPSVTLR